VFILIGRCTHIRHITSPSVHDSQVCIVWYKAKAWKSGRVRVCPPSSKRPGPRTQRVRERDVGPRTSRVVLRLASEVAHQCRDRWVAPCWWTCPVENPTENQAVKPTTSHKPHMCVSRHMGTNKWIPQGIPQASHMGTNKWIPQGIPQWH
jgi:hypothetical protein